MQDQNKVLEAIHQLEIIFPKIQKFIPININNESDSADDHVN